MSMYRRLEAIFFQPVSGSGFGLMRVAWAGTVFLFSLFECADVTRYYAESGLLPRSLEHLLMREELRFTLLHAVTEPGAVFALYLLLLAAALCATVGLWPKLSVILTTLLLFSFHEKTFLPLAGGETVLRNVGFILMLAPRIDAFSVQRLRQQWHHWKAVREPLAPVVMPAWPRILVVWQLTVIYIMSAWGKMLGDMWRAGTVVASVLHHPHFTRFPQEWMHYGSYITRPATYGAIVWEFAWLLLYAPRFITKRMPLYDRNVARRIILLGGVLFHGLIFVLLDVGSFSFAMLSAYFGVLLQNDFDAARRFFNRKQRGKIAVLYDGRCGLCLRSMFGLQMLDHLHRLEAVNFRDEAARGRRAPDLREEDLDRAMHIRFPDGRTEKGFFAFRALSRHIPLLWIIHPFLFVPPVAWAGQRVYRRVAERRNRCSHESCHI